MTEKTRADYETGTHAWVRTLVVDGIPYEVERFGTFYEGPPMDGALSLLRSARHIYQGSQVEVRLDQER